MAVSQAGRNLPPPQSPFVDKSTLNLSYDGYQFMLNLLNQALSAGSQKTVSQGLTATGTNQATALQLTSQWNEVDTVPTGTGILLSANQAGESQTVLNNGSNSLKAYPPPGAQINALGVNQPYTLAAGSRATFDFFSSTAISV